MSAAAPFDDVRLGVDVSAEDVVDALEFFDDWEDRYRYIIDLGKELPEMPAALKTDASLIRGCQSQVWIEHAQDEAGRYRFLVDSDAIIVRGLAAVVLAALNARSAAEIAAVDVDDYLDRLDLLRHISTTRGNGLGAMIERIRSVAASA